MTQYIFFGIVFCVLVAVVLMCVAIFKYRSSMLLLLAIILLICGACLTGYTVYGIQIPTVDEIMLSAYQSDFSNLKNNSDKLNGNEGVTSGETNENNTTDTNQDEVLVNDDLVSQGSTDTTNTDDQTVGSSTPTNLEDFLNSINGNIAVSLDSPVVAFPNNTDMTVNYTVCDSNGNTICWSDTDVEPGASASLDFTEAINAGVTDVSITAVYKGEGDTGNTLAETLSATITIE